eukprot:scaffold13455_cov57-Phaeocystis_antarctica.AAC.3
MPAGLCVTLRRRSFPVSLRGMMSNSSARICCMVRVIASTPSSSSCVLRTSLNTGCSRLDARLSRGRAAPAFSSFSRWYSEATSRRRRLSARFSWRGSAADAIDRASARSSRRCRLSHLRAACTLLRSSATIWACRTTAAEFVNGVLLPRHLLCNRSA